VLAIPPGYRQATRRSLNLTWLRLAIVTLSPLGQANPQQRPCRTGFLNLGSGGSIPFLDANNFNGLLSELTIFGRIELWRKRNSQACPSSRDHKAIRGAAAPKAARKGFQAGLKEIQASRKEIQASRKETQIRRKEIQVSFRSQIQTFQWVIAEFGRRLGRCVEIEICHFVPPGHVQFWPVGALEKETTAWPRWQEFVGFSDNRRREACSVSRAGSGSGCSAFAGLVR
jgi:hypothetical protein